MHTRWLRSLRRILMVGLGVIILVWLAGCGLIYSKMRKSPEDQNKEHQFGVSGAHGLKSTFRGNCANQVVASSIAVSAWRAKPRQSGPNLCLLNRCLSTR